VQPNPQVLGYDEYRRARYFPALDGLRAVSILLVVLFHVGSATFVWANGRLGVSVFFVLSGYLITTLLLRERDRDGRVSLSRFYLRRAFRILPLYYLVLVIYVAVYIVLGIGDGAHALARSLPWFLTYMNDFRAGILHGSTPYQQSWSLGVEEKFYLFWPLLGFVLLQKLRGWLAASAAAVPVLLYVLGIAPWFQFYGQIMVGCLLAMAMHHPVGFRICARAARGPLAIGATIVLLVLERHHPALGLLFPVAVAIVLAGIVSGGPGMRVLATRPMTWVGERAYAVYLIHLLCLLVVLHAARHVLSGGLLQDTVVFAVGLAVSLAAADLLRRHFEVPLIEFGRGVGLRRRERGEAAVPAQATG
jgi:peptidoglycan/LPS O-acetylase OafA/YrhL